LPVIANTLFTGKVFLQFTTLPSTNQYALDLITKNKPSEGTAISTAYQTEGRGQYGSQWISVAGKNITMSIIFYPNFLRVADQFFLNIAIALGVCEGLESHCNIPDLKLKWPNDIYANKLKLGGILIQNSLSRGNISTSVVGIGINLNQTDFHPALPNPGSVKLATGKQYDREAVMATLCATLEARYLMLRRGEHDRLLQDYYAVLYRFREMAGYKRLDGSQFDGEITGITKEGYLKIQVKGGEEEVFNLKEVQYQL